jgi:hypothetical protein
MLHRKSVRPEVEVAGAQFAEWRDVQRLPCGLAAAEAALGATAVEDEAPERDGSIISVSGPTKAVGEQGWAKGWPQRGHGHRTQ